jgi:hypothetical protein
VFAQHRLTLGAQAAAVAEANAAMEREALETTQRRHTAEERKHNMLARRVDLEQRAAQQALHRAKLEAELAIEAKRRAGADMLVSDSVTARVAAEREAAELAQQQAVAEAALAQISAGHRDARRAEVEAIVRRTETAAQRMNAANQEQWAAGEDGGPVTGDASEFSIAVHAEPAMHHERHAYLRWAMAGVGVIVLVAALVVPQTYRDSQGVGVTSEQTDSSLQGLKMTNQLSRLPDQAR